jgi:hypothetical protein
VRQPVAPVDPLAVDDAPRTEFVLRTASLHLLEPAKSCRCCRRPNAIKTLTTTYIGFAFWWRTKIHDEWLCTWCAFRRLVTCHLVTLFFGLGLLSFWYGPVAHLRLLRSAFDHGRRRGGAAAGILFAAAVAAPLVVGVLVLLSLWTALTST